MKMYRSSDVAMMRVVALDEGYRDGKSERDALVEALNGVKRCLDGRFGPIECQKAYEIAAAALKKAGE